MSRISVKLTNIPPFEELASLWRDLDKRADGSFFTAWPWIGTWLALLPPAVSTELVCLERDGACCGAAIAVRQNTRRHGIVAARQLHINETGNAELDALTIEHNGFAGMDLNRDDGLHALVAWFGSGAAHADELSLSGTAHPITSDATEHPLLENAKTLPAFRVDLNKLRAVGGRVGAILSPNARQQLNRSIRDLAANGSVTLEAAKTSEEALAFFDRLKVLHIRSWTRRGRRHAFASPFLERFHRTLIARAFDDGIELLRLAAGGLELGYLYNFCRNGRVYAYQSGFDDEDRRMRPGYVAHALAIERHAAEGDAVYDFMGGANRLKASFATDRYAMHWYTIQQPLLRFRAEHAARMAKSRLLRPFGTREP
jgi:CelD/BcsL family acetyltransferase involved in cellulose biosynthesis